MIRVLVDYAHNDLWHSLALLFEERYGWELYRPVGMDWHTSGIWRFEARLGDVVAKQFLAEWAEDVQEDGYSVRLDRAHRNRPMKMVTMDQAREIGFDLVIATLAENEEGLHGFAREIGAHYGIQVGNQGAPNAWGLAEFAMLSVTTGDFRPWIPHVTYHQEFSLLDYATTPVPSRSTLVATRVQCYTGTDGYPRFVRLAERTPAARFRHYGHCGTQDAYYGGDAKDVPAIARSMRATRVAWHDKRWSDGYGHVIHSWFAVGRPVLVSARYYLGRDDGVRKLAADLLVEGETSFDIDAYTERELSELITRLVQDDEFATKIGAAAARRFRNVVDFDVEAAAIRGMLDAILSDPVR